MLNGMPRRGVDHADRCRNNRVGGAAGRQQVRHKQQAAAGTERRRKRLAQHRHRCLDTQRAGIEHSDTGVEAAEHVERRAIRAHHRRERRVPRRRLHDRRAVRREPLHEAIGTAAGHENRSVRRHGDTARVR